MNGTVLQAASLATVFITVAGICLAIAAYRDDDDRWSWKLQVTSKGHKWCLISIAASAVGFLVSTPWVAWVQAGTVLLVGIGLGVRIATNRNRTVQLADSREIAARRARRNNIDRMWHRER